MPDQSLDDLTKICCYQLAPVAKEKGFSGFFIKDKIGQEYIVINETKDAFGKVTKTESKVFEYRIYITWRIISILLMYPKFCNGFTNFTVNFAKSMSKFRLFHFLAYPQLIKKTFYIL